MPPPTKVRGAQATQFIDSYIGTMKYQAVVAILSALSAAGTAAMVVATPDATKSCAAAGGAGVHVPVGKDGEGAYSASTKGW